MRMKNRFNRMGKSLLSAMCLLTTCGITYSCSDDFDLDETKPSFLRGSIYDELKSRSDRKFSTVVRLIDDLGYKDVMSQTGSKTLFVADDDAYKKFFEETQWKTSSGEPVRSYDDLTTAQKRLLFNGSMLNNAYVVEMLTTIQGPLKNLCLRRLSAATATDSIRFWKPSELPQNLNRPVVGEDGEVVADRRFWDNYNGVNYPDGKGILMATDRTAPMLTHFLEGQMNEALVTPDDVAFVLNMKSQKDEATGEDIPAGDQVRGKSFVYDKLIEEQDVTCLNGYYHVLSGVLETPQNMAEVIRTNGKTNFFSAMLDRFSAPFYNEVLTKEYNQLHEEKADSVFQKRYISQRSQGGSIDQDTYEKPIGDFPFLSYDPGWNQYTVSLSTKEQDMAAMFVPSDVAMRDYFINKGGRALLERYNKDVEISDAMSDEAFLDCLYQIPLNIVKPMIANLMKDSFNETVPSKFLTIMNDAQDQMFSDYSSIEDYKSVFDNVLMANNGVVYVMNTLIAPATYASVMAPVLYDENTKVVNNIIHADEPYVDNNYSRAPLRKFYHTYLLAMQSRFSFFVPTDQALVNYGYIDPIRYVSDSQKNKWLYWTFVPQAFRGSNNGCVSVAAQGYVYKDTEDITGQNGTINTQAKSDANNPLTNPSRYHLTKKNLMTEMIDQHILVHPNEDTKGVEGDANYYLSRSGAPVYVDKQKSKEAGHLVVDGGLQLMLQADENPGNDFDCEVEKVHDQSGIGSDGSHGYGNGMTYFLNRPMQPTFKTVYNVLKNTDNYKKFFELCNDMTNATALVEQLFRGDMSNSDWSNARDKYRIFTSKPTARDEQLVRFFSSYRYTVFVPSDEQIEKAINEHNLPTIEQIENYVAENTTDGELDPEAQQVAQAQIVCLLNFLKYHFCDLSLFVDNVTENTETSTAASATEEDGSTNFIRTDIKQTPGALTVIDEAGREVTVDKSGELHKNYNVFARDYEFNDRSSNAYAIVNSSYVVLHQMPNYLVFDKSVADDFSKAWETPAKAKAFAKKFEIRK